MTIHSRSTEIGNNSDRYQSFFDLYSKPLLNRDYQWTRSCRCFNLLSNMFRAYWSLMLCINQDIKVIVACVIGSNNKDLRLPVCTSKSWRISNLLSKFTVLSFQPDGLYSEQNTWKSRNCSERPRIFFLRVEYAQNDTQNIDPDSIRKALI